MKATYIGFSAWGGVQTGKSVYEAAAGEAPAQRPILPHATIGTLRRRILSTFDLGRFAIDVVICREGDPEKRQLQNRARLKLYRREEQ